MKVAYTQQTKPTPKILVYEEFDGHTIYRKGYKSFVCGDKTVEELIGRSVLQYFIIGCVMKALHKSLPDTYFAGSAQLGLRLTQDTNFSPDIAIFREGALQVGFHSTRYSDVPPNVVIEVDIKADESDYFRDEEEYFHKKTERLLQWGVERVIWVFSNSRRILVADNPQKWSFVSWELPVPVIDDYEINVWDLMLKNGFQADK